MTRLFDDEQSSSLITSMMNPESNATKFMEQGEDIGLPRDVTMDILNKYATYGANTGIGNIGGERLVNALNEEYRKRVDAPLQQTTGKAMAGDYAARIAAQTAEKQKIADASFSGTVGFHLPCPTHRKEAGPVQFGMKTYTYIKNLHK